MMARIHESPWQDPSNRLVGGDAARHPEDDPHYPAAGPLVFHNRGVLAEGTAGLRRLERLGPLARSSPLSSVSSVRL